MSRSETPLSELMELAGTSKEGYIEFLQAFRHSSVGVVAHGNPGGRAGTVQSTAENPFSVGSTKGPDGEDVILAFADPPIFVQRFGLRFNAEISGEDLLKTALSNPGCHGIQVNSAKREISVMIYRRTVQQLLGVGEAPAQKTRPWWKLW
jgi:hypothetical protein